ncbi:hypothetical protein KER63_26385 [Escherichia coli]|nr:hypothetical protein [Escherichia coli]
MPVQDVIPPYEQMYLLNQQLICNADQFKHAVITVGGQAVQYWISYYHAQYGDKLPDERLTTSVDCDYSAWKDDITAIAKTLNVKTWENKDGQPPSLAFVTKELPLKLAQLRERWERYVVLNAELAARGRRGFERNRR